MANLYTFCMEINDTEQQLKQVEDWLKNTTTEDGYIFWEQSRVTGAWTNIEEYERDHNTLLVRGESRGKPALFIANMIATQFPIQVMLYTSNLSNNTSEFWKFVGNNYELLDFSSSFRFDELRLEVDDYAIRDGFRRSREERVRHIHRQLYETRDLDCLKIIESKRSSEEWYQFIEEELTDYLCSFFPEDFVEDIPEFSETAND